MKNQQTYAVVDTDTGSLIGSGLTYEQKNKCLLLGELHLTVYKEAPSFKIAYDYELATQHNNPQEYLSMTHEQQIDVLVAAGKLEEAARYYDLHIAVPF